MRTMTIIITAFLSLTLLTSCSDGSSRKFGSRAWNQSMSLQDMALERAIIFDIMGGIAADQIEPDEMTLAELPPLEGEEPAVEESDAEQEEVAENTTEEETEETDETDVDAEKISISVPLHASYDSDYITSTTDSFEYSDGSGGTLTINVRGQFQKLNALFGDNSELIMSPIKVNLTFNNYVYVNSCGLFSKISGTISCSLQGEVDRNNDLIEANGNCTSGPDGSSGTIFYSIGEDELHEVIIQTSLRVNGPWYELTSYHFFGTYTIDMRTGTIDSVVSSPLVLCQEQY